MAERFFTKICVRIHLQCKKPAIFSLIKKISRSVSQKGEGRSKFFENGRIARTAKSLNGRMDRTQIYLKGTFLKILRSLRRCDRFWGLAQHYKLNFEEYLCKSKRASLTSNSRDLNFHVSYPWKRSCWKYRLVYYFGW